VFGFFARSTKEDIGQFASALGLTFPVGRENGLSMVLEAKELPVTILISKNGEIKKMLYEGFDVSDLYSGLAEILE
jgi:hypothetical protein